MKRINRINKESCPRTVVSNGIWDAKKYHALEINEFRRRKKSLYIDV